MINSDVPVIKEEGSQTTFSNQTIWAPIIFIGATVVVYLAVAGVIPDTASRFWLGFLGLAFGSVALVAIVWKYRLVLDLSSRTYSSTKGFWPHLQTKTGSLDDLDGVSITVQYNYDEGHYRPCWVVGLVFKDEPAVKFLVSDSEERGYQVWKHFVKLLKTTAVDRTEAEEKRIPWNELDRPLAETVSKKSDEGVAAAKTIQPPPSSSLVKLYGKPGHYTIVFPRMSWSASTLGALLLCLVFSISFAGGGIALLWMMFLPSVNKQGPVWVGVLVAALFIPIGLFFLTVIVFGIFGQTILVEEWSTLSICTLTFGRRFTRRRFKKNEIVEIATKQSEEIQQRRAGSISLGGFDIGPLGKPQPKNNELVIRTDKTVMRLGQDLTPVEQTWLKETLTCLLP